MWPRPAAAAAAAALAACNAAGPAVATHSQAVAAQQAKLLASDGADFDTFGAAVALSDTTAVVGAFRDDDHGSDSGAAYVYARSGASWIEQAKLTAADGAPNDNFGVSVAVSGDTALIASIFDNEATSAAGSVYVFVRSGGAWTQQAKLTAADAAPDDQLGVSVAISGDTAVVGASNHNALGDHSGAAYVFVRSGGAWTQQAELVPADGAAFDRFGISVAVSGDTALVGAFRNDGAAPDAGAAYVFVRSGGAWTQQAKLTAADAAESDELGVSVALDGDTAVLGAPKDDDAGDASGAAYVFARSGGTWTQQTKLTAADAAEGDGFGVAVSIQGDTAVIGAPSDGDLGAASGSAYMFGRTGTTWSQLAKLTAADGEAVDFFGLAVAASGTKALIGAFGDDDLGSSSGSAYIFALAPSNTGDACTGDGECASGFCRDGVCCNSACGGGAAGDCQACSVAAGGPADGVCGPRVAGAVCRAAAGACDVAETCTGSSVECPADQLIAAGSVCRAASGACDAAERCTGASAACPANSFAPAGQVCRPAEGSCDVREVCTGGSASCPFDLHRVDLSLCTGGLLGLPGVCLGGTCIL